MKCKWQAAMLSRYRSQCKDYNGATANTPNFGSPPCHHRHAFGSFQQKGLAGTHLLNAAHGLEIDVVAFPRSQRGVPEALVGPVVTHGERGWLRQVPRGQLGSKVVWGSSTESCLVGDGDLVALHSTRFSLRAVWVQLFNNDLVGTGKTEEKTLIFKGTCYGQISSLIKVLI